MFPYQFAHKTTTYLLVLKLFCKYNICCILYMKDLKIVVWNFTHTHSLHFWNIF